MVRTLTPLVLCLVISSCIPRGAGLDGGWPDAGFDAAVLDAATASCGNATCEEDEPGTCVTDCDPGAVWCPSPIGPFACPPDTDTCCWNPSCGCCTDLNPICTTDGCCTDGTGAF